MNNKQMKPTHQDSGAGDPINDQRTTTNALTGIRAIDLPTDRPRSASSTDWSWEILDSIPFSPIPTETEPRPFPLSFTTCLTLFFIILHRYSGENYLVITSKIVGGSSEKESLFHRLFWLDVSDEASFHNLEAIIQQQCIPGNPPLPKEYQDLVPIQFVFHFKECPLIKTDSPIGHERDDWGSNTELVLEIQDQGSLLRGIIHYQTRLYDALTVQRMLGHFQVLLDAIQVRSQDPVSCLPILTEMEQRLLLQQWCQPNLPKPKYVPLRMEVFARIAAEYPENCAIRFQNQSMTYRQLDEYSSQLAHLLRSRGAGANIPIGICLNRSPDLVAGILAVMKSGAGFVPLEPSLPKAILTELLTESSPPILITHSALLDHFPSGNRIVLCVDLLEKDIAEQNRQAPDIQISGDHLVMILFSSGSTGRPKTIPRKHDSYRFGNWIQETFQLGSADRHLLKTTLDSTMLLSEIFWPLLTGGQILIVEPNEKNDTAALLKQLIDHKITFISMIPSLLKQLLLEPQIELCTALRHVFCFGESMASTTEELFYQHLSASLSLMYGTTEVPFLMFRQGTRNSFRPLGNLGYPVGSSQIYILDRWLQPQPIGIPGELVVGSRTMSVGYQDDPIKTTERFIPHPFSVDPGAKLFRTGDRGRWRNDGSVEILGRLDYQVKIGGYRIEPEAIELVLAGHPQIRETVVVAQNGKDHDNRLIAYLVLISSGLKVRDLRQFLGDRLPAHMIPALFVQLHQLPRRPNGKIDRQALPSPEHNQLETGNLVIPPHTSVEKILANLWSEILECHVESINDGFFELGGTSLKATRLLAAIDRAFDKRLTPAVLYIHSTIARLAHLLEKGQNYANLGSIIEIRRGGSLAPLYFTRGMYGGGFVCEPIFKLLSRDQPIYGFAYEDELNLARRGKTLE